MAPFGGQTYRHKEKTHAVEAAYIHRASTEEPKLGVWFEASIYHWIISIRLAYMANVFS